MQELKLFYGAATLYACYRTSMWHCRVCWWN